MKRIRLQLVFILKFDGIRIVIRITLKIYGNNTPKAIKSNLSKIKQEDQI